LQPCRPGRARQFLNAGRAVVVRHTPFVIRLTDRALADSTVAGVQVGLDPGSRHTGIAVFTERDGSRTGKYSIQLDHRGAAIRDKLTARSRYRRGRRSRKLRYRAPRFLNRAKPKGWLAPSLRHRVDTTMSWVARLGRWAPVRAIQIERVAFDTHAMSAGKPLEGVEYQQSKSSCETTPHCWRASSSGPKPRCETAQRSTPPAAPVRLLQRADGYSYTTSKETTTER